MCGGTGAGIVVGIVDQGLSPRVRGNRDRGCWSWLSPGSIPACAGEPITCGRRAEMSAVYPRVCGGTPRPSPWPAHGRVYPRVCGGTAATLYQDLSDKGLSPRVRGNLMVRTTALFSFRSIPACAGEPRGYCAAQRGWYVYPRVCGGTELVCAKYIALRRLSPRVRGNLYVLNVKRRPLRSIPACAGEPRVSTSFQIAPKVYPRVCGGTSARRSIQAIE